MNRRKVVAFIDLENISMQAVDLGKVVDFEKLRDALLDLGEIIFAFVFLPVHYAFSLPDELNDWGFEIALCQKARHDEPDKFGKKGVLEDTVDIHIIKMGMKFCSIGEVTDIAVVSNDRHMVHLLNEARLRGKRVHVFGSAKIAPTLVRAVDMHIVHEIPLR